MSLRRLQIERQALAGLLRRTWSDLPLDLQILTARFSDNETVEFLVASAEFPHRVEWDADFPPEFPLLPKK
jgi:hypothetical protein